MSPEVWHSYRHDSVAGEGKSKEMGRFGEEVVFCRDQLTEIMRDLNIGFCVIS